MRFVIALFCATMTAAAQSAGGANKPAKIEGKVTHSVTGAPLPRVNVTLMPIGRGAITAITVQSIPQAVSSAVTGADGAFSLDNVPAGEYGVRVERNGFLMGSVEPTGSFTVTDGKEISGVSIKMMPQAVVVLKVVDENGEPVNRSMVQVMRNRFQRGRRQMLPFGSGQTNDLGEYRFPGLNPGTYYLSASSSTMNSPFFSLPVRQPGQTADEVDVTTYFPGTTDVANATPITLTAGQEMSITIPMRKGRTYRLRGVVPAGSGPNAQLMLSPRAGDSLPSFMNIRRGAIVRPDGSFEMNAVSPGAYTIMMLRPTAGTPMAPNAQAMIEVTNHDLEGIVLAPVQALTVKGRIVVEGNDQAAEKMDLTGARVFPNSLDATSGINFGSSQNTVAADGSFTLENIQPGRYILQIAGPSLRGVYLKSVKQGEVDITKTGLNLTEGSAASPIELVYSRKPGSIEITVMREPARKPGTVLLVPESPSAFDSVAQNIGFVPVQVNQNGTASAANVIPGKYRVYALETLDLSEGFDPDILKRVESKSERITVAEDQKVNVTVKQLLPSDLEAR